MHTSNIRPTLTIVKIALFTALLSSCGVQVNTVSDVVQPTSAQASIILTQATFGPTVKDLNRLETIGTAAWFNEQFAKPQAKHLAYMNKARTLLTNGQQLSENQFYESFWQQAIQGEDQLRQRVAYALSQIFVISFQNATLANMPRGVASYYDLMGTYAFGNFRDLLEAVTLHPMMGVYLSSLRNQATVGARVPDENYAREIMQLFTIGLRKLNVDGTDTTSPPTPTYINDDIKGLAKVFTGWSWAGADKSNNRFFESNTNPVPDPNRDWLPMQNYPQFHEVNPKFDDMNLNEIPKSVLISDLTYGYTFPGPSTGEESLKIALDRLFNHPNVGPFIGRELIQRLVTSNPSPEYITSVATAFNDNGCGCSTSRGDMKAVIKAIVLFPILNPTLITSTSNATGKLREPVIRLANWMRAFHATSSSGKFLITSLDSTQNSLGQTPMRSPSVFNFYRPEYQPPNTTIATANLVAPEMQITEETSVVGYLNYMRGVIQNGAGTNNDVKADYTTELALAALPEPDQLVDRVKLLLTQNQMTDALRTQIINAIKSNGTNSANNKVYLAIFLTMASPEYLVQK